MNDVSLWQMLASGLFGCLLTGIGMAVRGDFLGGKAADEVEARLSARMDREYSQIREQLNRIEQYLHEA